MNSIKLRQKPNDKIYTPPKVVDIMLNFCGYNSGESVLEPARGLGATFSIIFTNRFTKSTIIFFNSIRLIRHFLYYNIYYQIYYQHSTV